MSRISFQGETLELLPQRAMLWLERRALIITDPHFGKGAAFRSAGIPVPMGSTEADLLRLTALVEDLNPERLVILGDFFHTKDSQSEDTLRNLAVFRERFANLRIMVIRGNHDKHSGDPPASLDMEIFKGPVTEGPFCFAHHPMPCDDGYVLAGHLHPAAYLADRRGNRMKSPCFWFGKETAVLPAFGSFTGNYWIHPDADDRVFLCGPDEVVEIPVRRVSFITL